MKTSTTGKRPPNVWDSLTGTHYLIIGSVVLTIAIIGGFLLFTRLNEPEMYSTNVSGIEHFDALPEGVHRDQVDYDQIPPVGGPHNAAWQTCGVYTAPLVDEYAVHSLEHGAVWITYQPDLDKDQVDRLASITRNSTHRLLSPYPGIDSPIIISAWGVQLKLESADDERLMDFIRTYEQGPTTPELGGSCSGGMTLTAPQLGQQ